MLAWVSLLSIFPVTSAAFAQNTNSGDIRGTVTDTTGAVIPGVTVEVKDVDKGVVKTYVTNEAGLYDTGSITPDHYVITFTRSGFGSFVRGPITLDVSTQTIDAKLAVGSTEKIVVTTDVPLLSTESGALDSTLSADTIAQLPQTNLGADWENFIVLLPGAAGAPENSSSASNPSQNASINGNLPFDSVLADGATTTLPSSENSDVTIFETTAEIKISSNGFSAQYGQGGIIYNQITKGGTNQFHGAAYEYFSNDALNAFAYQFGATGVQLPRLRFNNFGFAVGGPVLRNKAFFFFDFDKTINNTINRNYETLPLAQNAAIANGDFTGPGFPTIYDPTTQTIQQTGSHTYQLSPGSSVASVTQQCPCVIRQSFADEYHNGNRIPASLLNPVSLNFQNVLNTLATNAVLQPANVGRSQTLQGVVTNNYAYVTPGINPFTKFFGRLDYDINSKNRFTASVTEGDNPGYDFGSTVCPINCESEDVSRHNAQVSDVWSRSSTLINEARLGFTDQLNFFLPATLNQGFPAKLGYKLAKVDLLPGFGPGSNVTGFGTGNTSPFIYKEFVYDPSDVVTLIRGRHVVHFGGEFLISLADSTQYGYVNAGSPSFSGNYTSQGGQITQGADTGIGNGFSYADFLLGQLSGYSASETPEYGARTKSPQLFVQDDWKLRPNLTVNLGLRYQIHTGWNEVKGNEAVFDPTVINPANNSLGAIWYGFSKANGRGQLIAPNYSIWLPRVGASWQPLPNTVVRGGFGLYTSTLSIDTYGAGLGAAFGSSGNLSDQTSGICPVADIDGDGSTPDTRDPGCGIVTAGKNYNALSPNAAYVSSPTTPDALNGQSVNYNQFHTPLPKNLQWNLDVQRQLGQSYSVDIAYVGNHGYDLNFPVDLNQVPESQLGPNDINNKPYPIYQNINGSTNNAVSNYNALQAQMTKRLTSGFQFNVNYVWSHFLDDLDSSGFGSREGYQNYQNAFNPHDNYSNGNFDIRNQFKGQVIYQLPFGRGKAFLNNNLLLDEVLGGWQVSSVWVVSGGNPIGITTGNNNSSNNQSGGYTQEANRVSGVSLKLPGSVKSKLNEYYNLSALTVPAPYTYGNFLRNTVYGPGIVNFAASLGKTFAVWPEQGVKLQIRADAGNVLNHPSFGQPGNNAIGPGESANITSTTVGGRQIQLYGRLSF
jgi:Carboxypeptidase regulatory-like domain/TonB dependent receptor